VVKIAARFRNKSRFFFLSQATNPDKMAVLCFVCPRDLPKQARYFTGLLSAALLEKNECCTDCQDFLG
jgi:hypothetical protein